MVESSAGQSIRLAKVQEVEKKMKEYVKHFFQQLKFGCHRSRCYNPYCAKNSQGHKYTQLQDKELIVEAIKFAKGNTCEHFMCIDWRLREKENSSSMLVDDPCLLESNVEEFLMSFERDTKVDFTSYVGGDTLPPLNLDLEKVLKYFSTNQDPIEKCLRNFNEFFSNFLIEGSYKYLTQDYKDIYNVNLLYYVFYLYMKSLFLITLNPNFYLTQDNSKDFSLFFEGYRSIKRMIKSAIATFASKSQQVAPIYLSAFEELSDPKCQYLFQTLISNCQNFLTIILFNFGSNDEETITLQNYNLLRNFMKTFKTFYRINTEHKIVHYREFYNDGLSKNLNFKRECWKYQQIMNKEYDEKKKKQFCLITYHWILDSAAKSDILFIFNYQKQRKEMFSSLNEVGNLANITTLGSLYLYLQVRRNNLIEDTLNYMSNSGLNFQKPLKVKFIGEQGIDEGGVKKEFFLLLVRQLFDPNYSMFSYNDKARLFWFNSYSFEPKIKFELIGIVLGLAFFNNVILDIKFPLVVYKKLLSLQTNLDDLREIDSELYNNFKYLLTTTEPNLKDTLCTTFTVTIDHFGEKEIIPLKEDGESIYIDESNREEYVSLYLDWYFNKSIENVFSYFRTGFYRVCDSKYFHLLRPEELELIICGTQLLDFKELEKSAIYDDGYEKDSITIRHFWEVIHSLPEPEQKKFLFFLTGCDRAPINGLGSLVITISRFGPDSDRLPCAHTCFNHLLLPDYQNKEKLRDRLVIAISNSEGFGLR